MNTATDWVSSLWHGFTVGIDRFMAGVPTVLGALLLLILGWMVSGLLAKLTVRFARAVHLDTIGECIQVNDFLSRAGTKMRASNILGEVIKWVIRLVFIEMAAEQVGLTQVTALVNRMLAYIPNILVALLVLGIGIFLSQLLGAVARGAASEAGLRSHELLAKLASGVVIVFAVLIAINQLGIAPIVVNTLFIGVVAAIALALGLAFGLGGRDTAARLTELWTGQIRETASRVQETGQEVGGGRTFSRQL